MRAATAGQREAVIRAAKFPRTSAVVPYSITRRIISDLLPTPGGGIDQIDGHIDRLATRLRREPEGWMQDELKRNIEALEAFRAAHGACKLGKLHFAHGPADLAMPIEGVRLNVRLDARLLQTVEDGAANSGGLVLFVASGDASRKNLADRCKIVAASIHWCLEQIGGNVEPLPKLCISFDVFGKTVTRAPTATERLRTNIHSSCREAARAWPDVAPPSGYDGPDWR